MDEAQKKGALVTFLVGPYHLCVPAGEVEAIIAVPTIRAIPFGPASISGTILYRDQTATVISTRRKLDLEDLPAKKEGQLILTRLHSRLTAFWVDEVLDLISTTEVKRHTLPSSSGDTIFNQFIIKNDDANKILIYTTFEQIYNIDDSTLPTKAMDIKTDPSEQDICRPRPNDDDQQLFVPVLISQDENQSKNDLTAGTPAKRDGSPSPKKQKSSSITIPSSLKDQTTKTDRDKEEGIKNHLSPRLPRRPLQEHKKGSPPIAQPPPDKRPDLRQGQKSRYKQRTLTPQEIIIIGSVLSAFFLFLAIWRSQPITTSEKVTFYGSDDSTLATAPPTSLPKQRGEKTTPLTSKNAEQILKPENDELTPARARPQVTKKKPTTFKNNIAAKHGEEILRVESDEFILTIERPQGTKEEQVPAKQKFIAKAGGKIIKRENDELSPAIKQPQVTKSEQITAKEILLKSTQNNNKPVEIIYIVVKGDTLWHIAKRYLGSPLKYPKLAELSLINDPDLIYPGDIIRIVKNRPSSPP